MKIIGVDTGGTFTDLIFQDGDSWRVHKLLSTPANPAQAVLDGLEAAAGKSSDAQASSRQILHGSTVATNAILERKGVRTALVTNAGFEDVIVIGRQNRGELYDLTWRREPQIVPDHLRLGVGGRMVHSGEEHEPLDEEAVREAARIILDAEGESVAVSLLFAFANPKHELRVREILQAAFAERGAEIPISLSHEILSEFREFERTSTTVVNAYVSPKMERYITFLTARLQAGDTLRIMQSNGGSISAETAMRESVRTILSGPAGGAVGALEIGRLAGFDRIITFDMGGTSTDVSLMDRDLTLTMESAISGYPVKTPQIDIHTVGAGGGFPGGRGRGRFAGRGSGECGRGPRPHLLRQGRTDHGDRRNLFLGRLVADHFLGGDMALDTARLDAAFADLAGQLGCSPAQAAEGVTEVANANMERAIRVISVERGVRSTRLLPAELRRRGRAARRVPGPSAEHAYGARAEQPRILSAMGMCMADVIKDYSHTVMLQEAATTAGMLDELFAPLEERGRAELAEEGITTGQMVLERYLDMRYVGQSFEILCPCAAGDADFAEVFHALHEKTYGYRNPDKPIQIVNIRLRAKGAPVKPVFDKQPLGDARPDDAALLDTRRVVFGGETRDTGIWDLRTASPRANEIPGPAVVTEYTSTILVPPFATARVDEYGNLVMKIESAHGEDN